MKQFNILLLGPYYKDNKPSTHNAEVGIYDALKQLGHNVAIYDIRNSCYLNFGGLKLTTTNTTFKIDTKDIDIVLAVGPGLSDEILQSELWNSLSNSVKILWSSEPIRLPEYRQKMMKQVGCFDHYFTFDESEIKEYADIGIRAKFLPQAYNPEWYEVLPISQKQKFVDHLIFIGSIGGKWSNRPILFNYIKTLGFKLNYASVFDAPKINKAYNMHEAVINLGLYIPESGNVDDFKGFGLQQRIFEAYGAGQVVITNEIPSDTNQIFENKKDILFYNKNNLKEVIEYALNRKNQKRMKEFIFNNKDEHTYKQRMCKMLNLI